MEHMEQCLAYKAILMYHLGTKLEYTVSENRQMEHIINPIACAHTNAWKCVCVHLYICMYVMAVVCASWCAQRWACISGYMYV